MLPVMSKSWLLVFVLGSAACDGGPGATPDAALPDAYVPGDILAELQDLDGVTFVEERPTAQTGYRYFYVELDQPVDHQNPGGQRFTQTMTLLHRDYAAPMVLGTTGYHNYWLDYFMEPTELISANQLVVEHRFFADSRPDPANWDFLRVWQAASDHHRIVQAFRRLYAGRWLSTGGSKGGMTSIYHRRFFPDDVDATVAYVAPISFGVPDARYLGFFDTVGTASCRQALHAAQREALSVRRAAMEALAQERATAQGLTFLYSGGLEAAVESDLAGFEWSFWQILGEESCAFIPPANATDQEIFDFFNSAGGPADDGFLQLFMPYFFQTEVELGYPGYGASYLADLLIYTGVQPPSLFPDGFARDYDPTVMPDIQDWVATSGQGILFVYGEYDPWTAGAFALGNASDSFSFVAAGASHYAGLFYLSPNDQATAFNALERWSGVTPQVPLAGRPSRRPPWLTPPPRRLPRP